MTFKCFSHCSTKVFFPSVEEIDVSCLWPGDNLLHIDVCYKFLASWVLHEGPEELEVTGHVGIVVSCFIALVPQPFTSPVSNLGPHSTVQNGGGWLQQHRPLMINGLL